MPGNQGRRLEPPFIRWVAALLVLSVLWGCLSFGSRQLRAESIKTVRVGYVENYGVFQRSDGLGKSGYGYEYLNEIAKETGWKYEFVPVEWREGLSKLATGEIDIFGPLQKNQDRSQQFDYPDQEMGYEYGALYVSQDNAQVFYNDLASFDGLTVGTEEGNYYNEALAQYCQNNDIAMTLVKTSASQLGSGLARGDFDAFVAGSLMDLPNTVAVAKIALEPYYYATTKGNAVILEGLNRGLTAIRQEDVYYSAKLEEKYYGHKSINMPAFTKKELDYIATHPVLTVACDPAWAPIEYYDQKTARYKGINMDVLAEVSKISGLSFNYLPAATYEESKRLMTCGQADLLMGYTQLWPNTLGVKYTKPFLEVPVMLVGSQTAKPENYLKVAMRKLDSPLSQEIMKAYPDFRYIEFERSDQVMSAIKSGQADAAFISAYVFDELVRRDGSERYAVLTTKISFGQSIGIRANADPILLEVLDKSLHRLTAEQLSSIVFANTVNRAYRQPLSRRIKENAQFIIGMLLLFLAAVLYINRRNKKNLEKLAYIDELTGVATLAKFKLDALEVLQGAVPGEYTLLTLDIANFKYINNSFGFAVGNQILVAIAGHFRNHLEKGELLGRIGADNFVFLGKTEEPCDLEKKIYGIHRVNEKIQGILPEHYSLDFSLGACSIKNTEEDFSNLLDKANIARKSTKGSNGLFYAEYTEEMDQQIEWKKEVTLSMALALCNQEFVVFFQPKYLLSNERLIGAEALARWCHPQKGVLAPDMFIPIFEQNGFIRKLDFYVFEQVCAFLKKWETLNLDLLLPTVSVNLSRLNLANQSLVEDLLKITEKYGIAPQRMEIELTESIVFHNTEQLIATMSKLRQAGFLISIDDFGSGYSSLNILKDLPVDIIKIDKAFLGDSSEVRNGRVIIESVTRMARNLNLTTVAEGVETREQAAMLRQMGCHIAQGYYYAKPMAMADFEKLLQKEK